MQFIKKCCKENAVRFLYEIMEKDEVTLFKEHIKTCKKCAKHCPSKSITHEAEPTWTGYDTPSNNSGTYKWYVDPDSCYNFWVQNGADCSNCIRVCPYTKSRHWSHGVVRWFIKYMPWLNRFWLYSDNLFGYGRRKKPKEFWDSDNQIHTR